MRGLVGAALGCAVALVLVVPAAPARASSHAQITSPAAGSTVDDPVALRATVQRGVGQSISSVRMRLVAGSSPIGDPVSLQCQSSCGGLSSGEETWGGASLDPRSPRAFGITQPLPNGAWEIEVSVNGGSWAAPARVLVSFPPSPVGGLNAVLEDRTVTLRWQLPPEPDVAGFHVERRRDGGAWSRVGSLAWSATSYRQTVAEDGRYAYRVFTVRPDGRGSEYVVASHAVEVTVGSVPQPSPSPSTSPTGDADEGATAPPPGDTETGTSDGASAAPTDESDGGSGVEAGETDGSTVSGGSSTSGSGGTVRSGRRIAPPPAVGPSVTLRSEPDPISAPSWDDYYYGEDEEYSDEIDYGDIDPVTGEPRERTPGEPQTRTVTHYLETAIGEMTVVDMRTLLSSVAMGLILITLALHLYNWMRQT